MGWLLGSLGYVANQVQNNASDQGFILLMTLLPAVFALFSVFIIRVYPLSDEKVQDIQQHLFVRKTKELDYE